MRKTLSVVLWLSFACAAQTHTFCPTDAACTWTGAQTFNNVTVGGACSGPGCGVLGLTLQNNGTSYGAVAGGQSGTFNFANCTVTGTAPSFVITCNGSGNVADVYNILTFGASPTASAAVNTAAIQAAINATPQKPVYIPSGTFLITPATADGHLSGRLVAFQIPAGTHITGPGTLKISDGVAAYFAVFYTNNSCSNCLFEGITVDANIANNPLHTGETNTNPRIEFLICCGTNITYQNLTVLNSSSTNNFAVNGLGAYNVMFLNNRAYNVGDDPNHISHDYSGIYAYGTNVVVQGNQIAATAPGAPGAATCLETHANGITITGNNCRNTNYMMNITGYDGGGEDSCVVSGNTAVGILNGIALWSTQVPGHSLTYGLNGCAVTGNTLRINQLAWDPIINASCIKLYPTNNLPTAHLNIADNVCVFDAETTPLRATGSASCIQSAAGAGHVDLTLENNTCANTPQEGVLLVGTGAIDVHAKHNHFYNIGSSLEAGLPAYYRSAFLSILTGAPLTGQFENNDIEDTQTTSTLNYMFAGKAGTGSNFQVLDNSVHIADSTAASWVNYMYLFSDSVLNPLLRQTATDRPFARPASGSLKAGSYAQDMTTTIPTRYFLCADGLGFNTNQLNCANQVQFSDTVLSTMESTDGSMSYGTVQNLMKWSESLGTAATWPVSHLTVSVDAVANPINGAVTADQMVEDSTASVSHIIAQSVTMVSGPQVYSVYAKTGPGSRNLTMLLSDAGVVHSASALFDLTNGAIFSTNGATAAIYSLSNGWYRCVLFAPQMNSGGGVADLILLNGSTQIYTGDGASGLYLWGSQINAGTATSGYVATTSAVFAASPYTLNAATVSAGTMSGILANGVTATTQALADNSTKVATTAYADRIVKAIFYGACSAGWNNLGTMNLAPFNPNSAACTTATGTFAGIPLGGSYTLQNFYVGVSSASNTPGGGVCSVYDNGSVGALTCTLGTTAACTDLTHTMTTTAGHKYTVKCISAGGTLTTGPTYSSGASSCTNGTQVVTFTNNTSGVAPAGATGTITVSGNVPTGAVTITSGGAGYTAATPPTQGTVATCTGTAVFTGGTVTVDAGSYISASFEAR